jgi:hypothetical protein
MSANNVESFQFIGFLSILRLLLVGICLDYRYRKESEDEQTVAGLRSYYHKRHTTRVAYGAEFGHHGRLVALLKYVVFCAEPFRIMRPAWTCAI